MQAARFMRAIRLSALVLAGALAAAGLAAAAGTVVVEGAWITLGDLVPGAGDAAAARVAEAPPPGESVVLSPAHVAAVAKQHGVAWNPAGVRGINVERAGTVVPRTEILAALARAAGAAAPGRLWEADIVNSSFSLRVAVDAAPTVGVEGFDLDPGRGTFTAVLVAPAGDPAATRVEVRGRAYEITAVPVLVNAVAPGTVIRASDIDWAPMRISQLRSNLALEPSQLIGNTPKRLVRAGDPVRLSDVQRPVVVAKGETVMMIVELPGLQLSAVGRALAAGGDGDSVPVMNMQTHATVEGIVQGPGLVRIPLRRSSPFSAAANMGR